MKTSKRSFLLLLCIHLFAPAAIAQSNPGAEKDAHPGMHTQEQADFREKMRLRMEKMRAEKHKYGDRTQDDKDDGDQSGSTYGQGFDSRNHSNDRPDAASARRPERPRIERFNHVERARP